MLAELGFNIYACDIHNGMLEATRDRMANFLSPEDLKKKIIKASIFNLPYPTGYFDFMIFNGLLHNTDSKEKVEKAIRLSSKILKKKGKLCINTFSDGLIAPELRKVSNRKYVYLTREGLLITLLPKKLFLEMMEKTV